MQVSFMQVCLYVLYGTYLLGDKTFKNSCVTFGTLCSSGRLGGVDFSLRLKIIEHNV